MNYAAISKQIAAGILPNRTPSRGAMRILVAGQGALFLLLWWRSPLAALPKPLEVVRAMGDLWASQGLGRELLTSFAANAEAIGITTIISLALSYLTVLPVWRPAVAVVSKFRFVGLTGLTFAFTIVIGGGHRLKVSLLVFGMTVFFVTSMSAVVSEIPMERFDYARTLRMGEWRAVWEVVVLGTADKAIEALRQNAAMGWMMLTMVEGISRSEGGVGAMLLNQNKHFRLAEVFGIQLLILAVGMAQDYGIGYARRILCPYSKP